MHITQSLEFPTTTDNSLENDQTNYTYYFKESWVRELGRNLAVTYSFICSLSTTYGYCFMGDELIASKIGISVRSLQEELVKLEKKNFIYRNTFSSKKGRKRHIVPKANAHEYWEKFLSRDCVPQEAKDDFLIVFMKHKPLDIEECNSPIRRERLNAYKSQRNPDMQKEEGEPKKPHAESRSKPPNPTAESRSKPIGDAISIAENRGCILPAENRVSFDLLPTTKNNYHQTKPARASGGEDWGGLECQLKGKGFKEEQIQLAFEFFKLDKENILKMKEPIAFLIWSLKSGKALERVQEHRFKQQVKVANENSVDSNKSLSLAFQKEVEAVGKICIVNDYSIQIMWEVGGAKQACPIAFSDVDFEGKLRSARRLYGI